MYTLVLSDGTKDQIIEENLSRLETWFAKIRTDRLERGMLPNADERMRLCAFIAAMHSRTKVMEQHHRSQWSEVQQMMDAMTERILLTSPEDLASMISSDPLSERSLTYEDVKSVAEQPLQHILPAMVRQSTPMLYSMDFAVLTTNDEIGFITSDSPCVWRDPEAGKFPPMFRGISLMSRTIEITLPISPSQCIILNRSGLSGFVPLRTNNLDDINSVTVNGADQRIVVRRSVCKRVWFDVRNEPVDGSGT